MKLYSKIYGASSPKVQAQDMLRGLSHYLDDDTLRFFDCRILDCSVLAGGLVLGVIEKMPNLDNSRIKECRYVLFDVFGNVIERSGFFKSKLLACAAMAHKVITLDAIAITAEASARAMELAQMDHAATLEQLKKIKGE